MFEFTMLAAAAKGTMVLAVASAIAWTLRKRSAAARHLMWTAAAAAVLSLPILSLTLPVLQVPVLRGPAQPSGAMTFFRVFSNGRARASTAQFAGTPASLRHATSTAGSVNPRQWIAAAWAAGAC